MYRIAVWSISSLGPFCWRVLSDCAVTWVPRGMTFDFHILPEHRRIGDKKNFPVVVFQ